MPEACPGRTISLAARGSLQEALVVAEEDPWTALPPWVQAAQRRDKASRRLGARPLRGRQLLALVVAEGSEAASPDGTPQRDGARERDLVRVLILPGKRRSETLCWLAPPVRAAGADEVVPVRGA